MKRLFSFMMALVLVLSLGVTAFAAENEEPVTATGSITITNATLGEDYAVYKIFNASISEDGKSVSYTIDPNNEKLNALLFDADGKPTEGNKFFVLNTNTKGVTKAKDANDSELTAYLQKLINENSSLDAVASQEDVTSKTVTFTGLPYGYYVIKSSLGTTVTINSNTVNVEVIDKNQIPGTDFDKTVKNGDVYSDSNSAGIGDVVEYKIEFTATNYDADKKIKYYQINDEKGDAIWAEFKSFLVTVGNKELKRGYYLCVGDEQELNTNNWQYLGTWTEEEKSSGADPEWYLVHIGVDEFRITIPWLADHELIESTNTETGYKSYSLKFDEDAESLYDSPSKVVIRYHAAIEGSAQIGGNGHNLYNEAYASWTSEFESGGTSTDRTETYVYGIGILKDDLASGHNLPGAEFRIYSNETCTDPVYVIPTDIEGVYVVDSLNKPELTGSKMETSRDLYEQYLAGYLGSDYETTKKQDNLLVTPVNGKVVVLGLEEGEYYVLETKAPDGYNALSAAVLFDVNTQSATTFKVFADKNGHVADIQTAEGDFVEKQYALTHTIIHNSTGVELPATGGEGTMMMITIGTMIAMAFAVLLITHKKMSIYQD